MFADLTLWTIRDSMFCCTLWIGPQVFTGGCLVTRGQGAGYWCCGETSWMDPSDATERERLFSPPTPRSSRGGSLLLLLAFPWPRFSPDPTAELWTNPQQKTSVWRCQCAGVCAQQGWQFAATISHSAVLNGRDSHGGSEPQPWCWVMWMSAWCFRGFMSEVSFLRPQESCTDTSPTEVRRSKCGFNYWGPRTFQHTLSFPLLFSANIPLLIYTLWSSFSLTVT